MIVFLLAACYDDKGNYDYEEINTITVLLDDVYSYRLDGDTTVCIIPELSQSLQKNRDNLEFMWVHSVINEFIEGHDDNDTISRIDTLRFHIVPDDPDFTPDGIQFQPGTGRFKGTCHLATLHSPS